MMQVEELEKEPEKQPTISSEDTVDAAMTTTTNGSHSPDDAQQQHADGATLAEHDLLGFAMSEGGGEESSNDLLGFSTPAETLASSTDDLLDFASAPTSMSTSPETEQTVVSVSEQDEETTQDLLGFVSTAAQEVAAAENQASTTTTDLLDLMPSVTESTITAPFADAESMAVQAAPAESLIHNVPQTTSNDTPDNPQQESVDASSEPPVKETESPLLHESFSEQPVTASDSSIGRGAAANPPMFGNEADTEVPTEASFNVLQPEVPVEQEETVETDGVDDSKVDPVEAEHTTTEKDGNAQTADTSNGSDLLQPEAIVETGNIMPENETAAKAVPNTDPDSSRLKASVPSLDVPGNDGQHHTDGVVQPAPDVGETTLPLSGDFNANDTAESSNNVTFPLDSNDKEIMSKSVEKPGTVDSGESQSEPSFSSAEAPKDIAPPQKSESMQQVELNVKDSVHTDNDPPVEDEDEGMADVELDAAAPMNPPVVAETKEPTVLSESVAQQVRQADPWQMDNAVETDTSDPTESFNKQANLTNEPGSTTVSAEPSPTMVDIPPTGENSSDHSAEKDALLVELQSSLQDHMSKQAEAEDRARKAEARMKQLEEDLRAKENVEKELEAMKQRMKSVVSDKANLELELAKLRTSRDEHERKEIVLSNRLNAAKKKEAVKADLAERLEDEVKELQTELSATKAKLAEAQGTGQKTEKTLEETTQQMTERVRLAETALADERRLNEDRKKKMKAFIESKQEEVRQGKLQTDELNAELEQTNRLLREQSTRWKQLHAQWVQSQTRNRELQRDLNRIKKDSDNMHKIGDKMEMKLSKSAQETEEHKTKRLTAKHELMTILRTLEGEREVSTKLRDSLKFTFTPKALSQQQLLKESLKDFDTELQKLSRRLGRPLPPSIDSPGLFSDDDDTEEAGAVTDEIGGESGEAVEESRDLVLNRSDIDSNHLISNLESETQRVSQCIMALMSSIERMHIVLDESGPNTCINALTNILMGNAPPQTSDLSGERASMRSTRYGQVPQANRDY